LDKKPLIWVVEDDASTYRLICAHLKTAGYNTMVYESAEKAYEALLSNKRPSLILLDMLLPGMSGVDLVRLLKQNKAWMDIPVVVVSVMSREQASASSDDPSAFWINKPFEADNLIQTVQSVLATIHQKLG
jgi:CheY-like chemotaxis protein